jgi:hypothetical protein
VSKKQHKKQLARARARKRARKLDSFFHQLNGFGIHISVS